MNKIVGILVSAGLMFSSLAIPVYAENTTTTESQAVSALQAQIQSLLSQINQLQQQLQQLNKEVEQAMYEFRSYMKQGSEGDEVQTLQEYLATLPDIYPEGVVTGYYGPLTEKAIKKFQQKYGIEGVGVVGPLTRAKLNELISGNNATNTPWGLLIAPGLSDKIDKEIDWSSIQKKDKIPYGIAKKIKHGDEWKKHKNDDDGDDEDDDDDNNTNNKDKVAPVISDVVATTTTTTTATILWNTNENTYSKIKYAESPLASAPSVTKISSAGFKTAHSVTVSGLTASTTYYFKVYAEDGSGNTSESSEFNFTTKPEEVVDTVAPIISNLSATSTASTTTSITWDTNEAADSKIEYATESLSSATSTTIATNVNFVTSHTMTLEGLLSATTYYFKVFSKDASGNSATSTESTFTTLSGE